MSTSIFIYTSILAICFSFVVAAPSDCRARYESWFDSSKTVGSFGFTLQNNSESLLLYSFGNILYSPPPFDYYTNVNSFITYSDAGSPAAGMPVFAPAEPPFLFFDARALIIRRNGLISISSVGEMGSSVQFEVTCDGDVFTGVGPDGNLYVLQFHPPASSTPTSAPTSSPTPSPTSSSVTTTGSVQPTSAPTTSPSTCQATVTARPRNGATWKEGGASYEVFDLAITNTGTSKLTSLSVDLSFSAAASVSSTWNLGQSSTSSSTYIVSINEVYPGSSLNNFAGLIVKDGSVSVSSISVVCA
eukprot:TRINITY_DN4180_c0_g1_i2.p1 TRINITY_DN4180_c0_g1~~TRINITY_DN4180_c0_g1_i2.p1  ORF type:complete len:302 (-),score=97.09 TRINITY_DN4180_c0_g1_i2:39-944(-)